MKKTCTETYISSPVSGQTHDVSHDLHTVSARLTLFALHSNSKTIFTGWSSSWCLLQFVDVISSDWLNACFKLCELFYESASQSKQAANWRLKCWTEFCLFILRGGGSVSSGRTAQTNQTLTAFIPCEPLCDHFIICFHFYHGFFSSNHIFCFVF